MKTFLQDPPALGNQYLEDTLLKNWLHTTIPHKVLSAIEHDLIRFGESVATSIKDLGNDAENCLPYLTQFDAWNVRVDEITTSSAWQELHHVAAREGLVSIGYERDKYFRFARIYQFVKLYLFDASSAVYTCPLAMTDGAARLLETLGTHKKELAHLTSRDPKTFWTSGQWMTEKTGGSDLSRTETIARHIQGKEYALSGFKWFTSATDSNMTILLAKVQEGQATDPGLSMFLLRIRNEKDNKLNGIKVQKLKKKLGTQAVPTAELALKDAKAELLSTRGRGVASITPLLNMTRIYNACASVSAMRRIIALVQDYATKRQAQGKYLQDMPLHVHAMAKMVAEHAGSMHMFLYVVELLGKSECNDATDLELQMLRLFVPILKLYTAKQAIKVITEGMELIGGMGYIEDSKIPRILRNGMVMPIWEGTTNILSLDVLRVFQKSPTIFQTWNKHVQQLLQSHANKMQQSGTHLSQELQSICTQAHQQATTALNNILKLVAAMQKKQHLLEAGARELAFSIAHVQIVCLFLDYIGKRLHATDVDKDIYLLHQFVLDHTPLAVCTASVTLDDATLQREKKIAMDLGGYKSAIRAKY